MRWGISIFFAVLILITGLSFLIRYPDLVATHMVIYAEKSSPVNSKAAGLLIKILVRNGQKVKKDQPLAFIEAGGIEHGAALSVIDSIQKLKNAVQSKTSAPGRGEISLLNELIARCRSLLINVAPPDIYDSGAETRGAFITRTEKILITLNRWKEQYVLSAPLEGTVSVAGLLQEGQTLKAGQSLFYVNSDSNSAYYGSMTVSQHDITKIKKGQRVLVKLSSYAFENYGLVKGTIDSIGELPLNDSVFLARVKFEPIINKNIVLKSGLSASSDVVTADITLMDRVAGNIKRSIIGGN